MKIVIGVRHFRIPLRFAAGSGDAAADGRER